MGHPEADGYAKHLLTLLAQRRELQTDDVRRVLTDASVYAAAASPSTPAQSDPAASGGALDGGAPAPLLPASIFSGTVTAASIDKERRELQSELSMGLEWRPQPSVAEACRAAVEGAGKPMAGERRCARVFVWRGAIDQTETGTGRARRATTLAQQRQVSSSVGMLGL